MRLGLHLIANLGQEAGERIAEARRLAPFADVADLARRASLERRSLEALSAANALSGLAGHRRQAAWAAAVPRQRDLLEAAPPLEEAVPLPSPTEGQELVADYGSLGLTLGRHPLALLRRRLADLRYATTHELRCMETQRPARCAGIVTCRQRPGTAGGTVFVTLEDETGLANVIVHGKLVERQRAELLGARLLGVLGVLQREGEVVHLVAKRLVDHTALLGTLPTASRDFC